MSSTSTDLWVPTRPQTRDDPYPPVTPLREFDGHPSWEGSASDVKGRLGEEAALELMAQWGFTGAVQITDTLGQMFRGDDWMPSGFPMEVKSQPISPLRYRDNVIEIARVGHDGRAEDPWPWVAAQAGLEFAQLLEVGVSDMRRGFNHAQFPLGDSEHHMTGHGEPSLWSTSAAALTVYINPVDGWAYVYWFGQVLADVRRSLLTRGIVRGVGNCEDHVFAVFAPNPPVRFQRVDGRWLYDGDTDLDVVVAGLTAAWYGS